MEPAKSTQVTQAALGTFKARFYFIFERIQSQISTPYVIYGHGCLACDPTYQTGLLLLHAEMSVGRGLSRHGREPAWKRKSPTAASKVERALPSKNKKVERAVACLCFGNLWHGIAIPRPTPSKKKKLYHGHRGTASTNGDSIHSRTRHATWPWGAMGIC